MNNLIKVIKRKSDKEFLVMRKHLGTANIGKKEFNLSTNFSGVGLHVERNGNMIALDTEKFLEYVLNNFDDLLNEGLSIGVGDTVLFFKCLDVDPADEFQEGEYKFIVKSINDDGLLENEDGDLFMIDEGKLLNKKEANVSE